MIYALFNSDTGVFQCAIQQGASLVGNADSLNSTTQLNEGDTQSQTKNDGGSFNEVGDDRWKAVTATYEAAFHNSTEWLEISQEDFDKYLLGRHGGDNDTGYIRDLSTGECVPAPARPRDVQIANVTSKYNSELQQLNTDYQNDLANAQLTEGDATYVTETYKAKMADLIEESNAELISVIEAAG